MMMMMVMVMVMMVMKMMVTEGPAKVPSRQRSSFLPKRTSPMEGEREV